jgi:sec-independent protein translocase protein TatA
MFQNIGTGELLVIALVITLLFGGKKLPELAKGLGEASREFRKALGEQPEESAKKDSFLSSPKEPVLSSPKDTKKKPAKKA